MRTLSKEQVTRTAGLLLLSQLGFLQAQTLPCQSRATRIENCPATGCAVPFTPEARANEVRNRVPAKPSEVLLTVEDFERLQNCVKGQQGLAVSDRSRFGKDFQCLGAPFLAREGMVVDVFGYLVGIPRARRRDPTNCLLVGSEGNSFRINIAALSDDPEYDSFVAELVPYNHSLHRRRECSWTLEALRRVKKKGYKIHITGQLFYDNRHLVNADPDDVIAREPKRMSLWEIHPVTAFEVCKQSNPSRCGEGSNYKTEDWTKLECSH